jgi:hypothetical protein
MAPSRIRLSTDPTAEIDVAAGSTRPIRIHVEADVGMALFAIAASSARNVEQHRHQIAFVDKFNAAAAFDDFARNLVCPKTSPDGAVVRPRTMRWSLPQTLVVIGLRMTPWSIFLPCDVVSSG